MPRYLFFILLSISTIFSITNRHSCLDHNHEYRSRPERDAFILSPSGYFYIHYDIQGFNAPNLGDFYGINSNVPNGIPDYIDEVALAADKSKEVIINQLGFLDVVEDDDMIYDIYVKNYSAGVYGYNIPDLNIPGASYIEIDNAYEENMYLTSGLNTMRLTVAHEFFHAVQRSYRNNLSFGEGYFWEMSSTWIEDIIVPDGNDYIYWVDNFFEDINQNISSTDGYSIALFGHYLKNIIAEGNPEIIKKIWERYSTGVNPLNAIKYVLEIDYNTSFEFCWTDFCARNYFNSMYQNMDNDIYYHIDQKDIVPIQTLDLSLSNPLTISSDLLIENELLSNQGSLNDSYFSDNLSKVTFEIISSSNTANIEGFASILSSTNNSLNRIVNIQSDNNHIYIGPGDIFYFSLSSNQNCIINGNLYFTNDVVIVYGDANLDNEINILDIILTIELILNNSLNQIQFENIDINFDNSINIFDIILIIENILNQN